MLKFIFLFGRGLAVRGQLIVLADRQTSMDTKLNNNQQKEIGTETHAQAISKGKRIRQKIGI